MLRHVSFKKSTNWRRFLVTKRGLKKCLPYYGEDYGIHGKNPPARETSGIKRLAIMHDDGVNAFGFKHPNILLEWMIANGFPVRDVNLALYD